MGSIMYSLLLHHWLDKQKGRVPGENHPFLKLFHLSVVDIQKMNVPYHGPPKSQRKKVNENDFRTRSPGQFTRC